VSESSIGIPNQSPWNDASSVNQSQQEPLPLLLAISRITGSNLYVKKFNESMKYDEHLIGIGLHAFRIFLQDSFNRDNISTITMDELTVRMTNIDNFVVYYIFIGNSDQEEEKFFEFVNKLVTSKCWDRFSNSDYVVYKNDTKSISNMVEEIFI
jgi:hypothetical protein